MYPLCILMYFKMYLKCPVIFQENTCILVFCVYFTRIPNESKIHFRIHIRYIKIHVSWALAWCHTGYISRYITIRVSWILYHDTSRYTEIQNHDTCILDASWRIYVGYMQGFMRDTCGIHVSAVVPGYIDDTCGIHQGYIMRDMYLKCMQRGTYLRCKIHARYMQDTCILRGDQDTYRIHPRYIKKYIVRYMYLNCIRREMYLIWRDTCGIHAGYMRDTCGIHVSSVVIKIHAGHMRDTCGIHAGYMQDTYLGGWGNVSMPSSCQSDRYKCILMYLDVSWCILIGHIEIHARYMQDTSKYIRIRIR